MLAACSPSMGSGFRGREDPWGCAFWQLGGSEMGAWSSSAEALLFYALCLLYALESGGGHRDSGPRSPGGPSPGSVAGLLGGEGAEGHHPVECHDGEAGECGCRPVGLRNPSARHSA